MGHKNRKKNRPSGAPVPVQTAGQPQKKKRFYTRATVLHCVSLIVSLVLVCYLSFIIITKPLAAQHPTQVSGWIQAPGSSDPSKRQEFQLNAEVAQEIATLIDRGIPVFQEKGTPVGALEFKFPTGQKRKYDITRDGVHGTIGFRRHRILPGEELQKIIRENL